MNSKPSDTYDPICKRSHYERIAVESPLDLSFKKARNLNELAKEEPQKKRTGKIPKRTTEGKFLTGTLWLNNNALTSMEGLYDFANQVIRHPSLLTWLDLSFNQISSIDEDVGRLPGLKILYLHGNNISNAQSIIKLKRLRNLRSLTLHGNPVETLPSYRRNIIRVLSQLTTFDFSQILVSEKKAALLVGSAY